MKTLTKKILEMTSANYVEDSPVKVEVSKSNESVHSNGSIEMKIGGNRIYVSTNCSVNKCADYNGPEKDDDADMQLKISNLIKADVDMFLKSVGEKIKAIKGI